MGASFTEVDVCRARQVPLFNILSHVSDYPKAMRITVHQTNDLRTAADMSVGMPFQRFLCAITRAELNVRVIDTMRDGTDTASSDLFGGIKIGYAHISTDDQTLAMQIDALNAADCVQIYQETASGKQTEDTETAV